MYHAKGPAFIYVLVHRRICQQNHLLIVGGQLTPEFEHLPVFIGSRRVLVTCLFHPFPFACTQVQMPDGQPVQLRVGLHTGPCVSGLVGFEVPKWSVFGDTGALMLLWAGILQSYVT